MTRTLLLAVLMPLGAVAAEPPAMDPVVESQSSRVEAARSAAYEASVAEFDRLVGEFPDASSVLIGKCRFIQTYAWDEDSPIERAGEDHEQCLEALRDPRYAEDPVAQLFLLGELYGEEAIAAGEDLLKVAKDWSPQDRARIYESLSYATRFADEEQGARFAEFAVRDDPSSALRLYVAKRWLQQGAFERAVRLINETPADAWKDLSVQEGAALLLAADAPADAAALVLDHAPADQSIAIRVLRARGLAGSGKVADARGIYASIVEGGQQLASGDLLHYLRFQLSHGTAEQAIAAYGKLRDGGYTADPVARYRLELSLRHPLAPWHWRDVPGVLVLLLALAFVAMLPGLFIACIHYRSLARRVRGDLPREGRWGLRQVWVALALLLLGQALATYIFYYPALSSLINEDAYDIRTLDMHALAWATLLDSVFVLLCLLPLLRGINLRELLLGHTKFRTTLGLAFLAYLGVRILGGIYGSVFGAFDATGALGDMTTLAIQSTHVVFGATVGLLSVALVIPLVEEFVFRGVMLQGLSRYISFGWAALIQALVFALLHESVAAMPVIFLLGYLAAWLVRRTGGLLAPILLHVMNNTFAYNGIVLVTSVMNGRD
jgi:uncharacterized protein